MPSLPLYGSHLRLVPRDDQCFSMTCGMNGRNERFETFGGFNIHTLTVTTEGQWESNQLLRLKNWRKTLILHFL